MTMTPSIRTLTQARAYILRVGICGIFAEVEGNSLWEMTDLPERQPGEKGWGQKVISIWGWKNELPAKYPDEIFYGKVSGGGVLAVLMSLEYLRKEHYPKYHRPISECSPLAQKLYQVIRLDPLTTPQLREEMGMAERPMRNRLERALQELQITLNIVRRNASADTHDTWVLFSEQYSI